MNHPDEKVALQAIEFWSTVCDEEVERKEEAYEVITECATRVKCTYIYSCWVYRLLKLVRLPNILSTTLPILHWVTSCQCFYGFLPSKKKTKMRMSGTYPWLLLLVYLCLLNVYATPSSALPFHLLKTTFKTLTGVTVKPLLWHLVRLWMVLTIRCSDLWLTKLFPLLSTWWLILLSMSKIPLLGHLAVYVSFSSIVSSLRSIFVIWFLPSFLVFKITLALSAIAAGPLWTWLNNLGPCLVKKCLHQPFQCTLKASSQPFCNSLNEPITKPTAEPQPMKPSLRLSCSRLTLVFIFVVFSHPCFTNSFVK